MDKEEIKKAILRQFYDGVFKGGADYQVSLSKFALDNGIDAEQLNIIYGELRAEGLLNEVRRTGMVVAPSVKALVHCEDNHLPDQALIEKQNNIRKIFLEACLDIQEKGLNTYAYGESGDTICQRANIDRQDFDNNVGILEYCDYLERQGPFDIWGITLKGRDRVKELRKRRKRLEEFKILKVGNDITPQERGHKLEDLLEEVIADEGWKTEKRVRQKGAEFDIVFNKDFDYFMASCKWEKNAIGSEDVDQLAMRALEMKCIAGILVSISRFTDGCVELALAKRPLQQVVLFGPGDIETVFKNERRFSDLLDEKIKELKHRSRMLIDGNTK